MAAPLAPLLPLFILLGDPTLPATQLFELNEPAEAPVDDPEVEPAEAPASDPAEGVEQPTPAPSAADPEAKPEKLRTGNEWMIHIAPGANFVFSRYYKAYGPTARFGGLASRWIGNAMIGGGPVLTYGYLLDPSPAKDRIQFFTLQGDFMVGGGRYEKFAIFAHLSLGGGAAIAFDGATKTKLTVPWIRAAAGVGAYGYITPRFSLGTIVDFGYLGGLGVDVVLTANIHFGQGTKKK